MTWVTDWQSSNVRWKIIRFSENCLHRRCDSVKPIIMSTKERAIAAIDSLPADSDMVDILREIVFVTGTDDARKEIARGEGMDATEAKAKLREWITE